MPSADANLDWGASYRLVAAEKWRAKSAAMGGDVTRALVEYARPQPGMKVLDLASGTGEPAISIASLIAPDGHITALDRSAELLEIAEQRARQRHLTNLSLQQADANKLSFPDQTFDLVTSRFGIMFLGDEALREAYRVLKPGARACFAAWGPFEQPYWSSIMGVVHKHVGGLLLPAGQDPFKYGEPGSLSTAMRRAGFAAEEETRQVAWTWPGTAEEVWQQAQASTTPFLPMLQRVPAEKWETINAEVLAAIGQYTKPDGIHFGAVIMLAAGVKV